LLGISSSSLTIVSVASRGPSVLSILVLRVWAGLRKGGRVEQGESDEAAAVRECFEESGLDVDPAKGQFEVSVLHF